jgi:hypothetical protein
MRLRPRTGAPTFLLVAAAFALALLAPAPGLAQKQPPPPSQDRSQTYDMNQELRSREANITLMERGKTEAARKEAALKQMNEDFTRLQSLNVDIATAYAAGGTPDYRRVTEDSAEIRTRASRLKNSLMLPPTAKDEKREKLKEESGQDGLQGFITALDGLVKSFVSNPVFQKNTAVNYQQVAKARRDLDGIIEVSDRIKKAAERLGKSAANPN